MCESTVVSCNKKKKNSSTCLVCSYRNHCVNCRGHSKPITCQKCIFGNTNLCNGLQKKRNNMPDSY